MGGSRLKMGKPGGSIQGHIDGCFLALSGNMKICENGRSALVADVMLIAE